MSGEPGVGIGRKERSMTASVPAGSPESGRGAAGRGHIVVNDDDQSAGRFRGGRRARAGRGGHVGVFLLAENEGKFGPNLWAGIEVFVSIAMSESGVAQGGREAPPRVGGGPKPNPCQRAIG